MSSKEHLTELEQAGKHVFHGSPEANLEILEPRQATFVPHDEKPTEITPDGEPAVSATSYADIATFRAIVNPKNIPIRHSSQFGVREGETYFGVSTNEVLDHAKNKKGYVYVFDKNDFKPFQRDGSDPMIKNME